LGRAIACVFMVWIISHRAMALSFGYGRMPPKKKPTPLRTLSPPLGLPLPPGAAHSGTDARRAGLAQADPALGCCAPAHPARHQYGRNDHAGTHCGAPEPSGATRRPRGAHRRCPCRRARQHQHDPGADHRAIIDPAGDPVSLEDIKKRGKKFLPLF